MGGYRWIKGQSDQSFVVYFYVGYYQMIVIYVIIKRDILGNTFVVLWLGAYIL